MADAAGSLQVTALLDELLGVSTHKGEVEVEGMSVPEASRAASPGSRCVSSSPNAAQLAELCGEIEDLNTEMDACIASIGRWEEESRQRREDLERELEHCYGAGRAPLAEAEGQELAEYLSRVRQDDLEQELGARYFGGAGTDDAVAELEDVSRPASAATCSPVPAGRTARRASPSSPRANDALAAMAQEVAEDEARIAKLRAEVEQLRRCQDRPPFEASEADLDLSPGSPEARGLRAPPGAPEESHGRLPFDIDVDDQINELEGRLHDARSYLGHMEEAIGEVNCNVDNEINELEKLLNECDAACAQIQPTVA